MTTINLIPPEIAAKRRARRQAVLLAFLGAVFVVLLGGIWLLRQLEVRQQERRFEEAQASAAEFQIKVDALQEFADLDALVREREAVLATVMQGDVAWSRLLVELSMVVPGDAWLSGLVGAAATPVEGGQASPPGTPSGLPAEGQVLGTLNFTGTTFDFPGLARWITRLQTLESLQNIWVPTGNTSEIANQEVVEFTSTSDLSTGAASKRFAGADQ